MCKFILSMLPMRLQKELAIWMLKNVLYSKTETIGDYEAVSIIELIVKSSGNKVTSFIVKD
jgi:hypothetical protein